MRREILATLFLIAVTLGLCWLPSTKTAINDRVETSRAKVIATDDSGVQQHGAVKYGTQHLRVRLPDGSEHTAVNELRAQLELDKHFKVGDTALVVLGKDPLVARDHWRLGWVALLFGGFVLLLAIFAGWTGLKAVFSFAFSCVVIWKLLIPECLAGWNASLIAFAVVAILTAVIMYLIAGWSRRGLAAFLGSMLGVGFSLVLAYFFTIVMKVDGATMPFVQSLLYSDYGSLNLADIFVGAVILASSGAVMDLGMDIAAGVAEVARHNAALSRKELFGSGLRIGQSVVGTMTTTLLLAYSGGYLTLLMVFAAQGTRPIDFINSTLVSTEIVMTLVGSFGLVLVAPFTALVSAMLFGKRND